MAVMAALVSSTKLAAGIVVSVAPIIPAVMVVKKRVTAGDMVVVTAPPEATGAVETAVKTGLTTGI